MSRVRARLFCLLWAAAAAGCAGKGPVASPAIPPPPVDAREYYPLAVGWRWAYEIQKGGDRVLATYAVIEQRGDAAVVEAGTERISYSLQPGGVARREGVLLGDYVLKSPIVNGATWALADGRASVVAIGRTIEVPAGRFPNCAIVEESREGPSRVLRTTYAAGVGPIAVEYQVRDASTGKVETALKAALLGVARPGEDPLGADTAPAP